MLQFAKALVPFNADNAHNIASSGLDRLHDETPEPTHTTGGGNAYAPNAISKSSAAIRR
jgi:hypothetical protein